MINKAHIKIGDVIYGSSDSVDIIYDNTESGLESNNIQDAIDEIAAGVCFADGIVVNVEMANWIAQEDGTYTNTVAIEGILESEMYDVSLYGDSTEEQAHAFDFLVTDIDTYDGQIVLTASEEITVAFSVILRGKVNLENKNVYVSDLSATNIEYDNSESNMEATDMQNAIDELATSVKGIVIDVTTDSWDLQEDGTYKKVIAVDGLTGKEVLDVCLDPSYSHTEEQITVFSELVTSIETAEGRIILTASEAITVEFSILLYGKVGFNVCSENGGSSNGSGNANIVKLTQSEYDALPESKKSDGILYAITDGECSASGGSSKPVELTKAEYEALGDKVNSDGILYAITDGDGLSAKNMAFDDTETQLGVNNVQDAIVEQNKNMNIIDEAISKLSEEIAENNEYPFFEKVLTEKLTQGTWTQRTIDPRSTVICVEKLIPIKKGDTIKYDTKDLYMSYGVYVGSDTISSGYSGWINGSGECSIEYGGLLFVQFTKDLEATTQTSISDFNCDVEINNKVLGHKVDEIEKELENVASSLNDLGDKNVALFTIDESLFGKYSITDGKGTLEESQYNASTIETHSFSNGNFISIDSDTFRIRVVIYSSAGAYLKTLDWLVNDKFDLSDEAINGRMLRLQITTQVGVTGFNFDIKEAIKCIDTNIGSLLIQKYSDVYSLLKANTDSIERI